MKATLFKVIEADNLYVVIDGYEIDVLVFTDDLLLLGCGDEPEWFFADQVIDIDEDGRAMLDVHHSHDGGHLTVIAEFTIRTHRPITEHDIAE